MKLRYIAIVFSLVTLGVFLFFDKSINNDKNNVIDMVDLNDIYQNIQEEINKGNDFKEIECKYNCKIINLSDENYKSVVNDSVSKGRIVLDYYVNENEIKGKIIFYGLTDNYTKMVEALSAKVKVIFIIILVLVYILLYYLYRKIIEPFIKLKVFAANVAKGNFDIPLEMKKDNYFGAFTESFDLMREELKKAKENEYKANLSKKELVASLSHDIKTPVSTIEAICELLGVKVKEEELLKKIRIIHNKAEVIDKLINNMFHATLEELECLEVEKSEEATNIILDMLMESDSFNRIKIENELPGFLIYADKLRLNQVIDNIINNSYKYADTDINVSFREVEDGIIVVIADKGKGVSEDELPLLTEKFYRGSNSKGKTGSGLGLFLSKQFMNKMCGDMQCYCANGFVVELYLKKVTIKK